VKLLTRAQWGHPGGIGPAMRLPASTLYCHHSVTPAGSGPAVARTIASIGIQRFGRSSYSYVIDRDGVIYELQGNRIGAHTRGQNSTSLAACAVGNYETLAPNGVQLRAYADLYRHLVARGWLRAGAPIRGHRDAPGASTACPGRLLYAQLPAIRRLVVEDDRTEDEMTPEQVRMLEQVRDAVGRIDARTQGVQKQVDDLRRGAMSDRNVANDLRLLRLAVRKVAAAMGLKTKHTPPDEIDA
jgi:hypothetical protein